MKLRRKIDAFVLTAARGQAADEVIEADEGEHAGQHAPQRRRIEHDRAGRERVEDDKRAEEPGLDHQEMVGTDARGRGLFIDEVADAIADHRHEGEGDGLTHHGVA